MAGHGEIEMRNKAGEIVAVALVDLADLPALSSYTWCWDGRYPRRNVWHPGGRQESVRMHRQILGLDPGDPRQGDHRNGDRLDNRRGNLRIVPSQAAQVQNVRLRAGTSSHRGVFFDRARGKWVATCGRRRKRYATEDEAAAVAAAWRREMFAFAEH